jgi:hypothetical protein
MGVNQSNATGETITVVGETVTPKPIECPKQYDGTLRIDPGTEIYFGDIRMGNIPTSRLLLNIDNSSFMFIASDKEYNEYGKVFWYKFGIAALIIMLIIQFFVSK